LYTGQGQKWEILEAGKDIRRGLLQRVPYGVFYLAEKEKIVGIGLIHCKRTPETSAVVFLS